jgi:hypothetical protein
VLLLSYAFIHSDDNPVEILAFDVSSNPGPYFTEVVTDQGSGANADVRFFRPTQGLWFGQTAIRAPYDGSPLR